MFFFLPFNYLPHVLSQAGFTFLVKENESYFFFLKERGKNIHVIDNIEKIVLITFYTGRGKSMFIVVHKEK